MKNFLLIALLLLISFSSFSQDKWQWYNPYPDGIVLNSVWFVDEYNAWAVGNNGKILHWDGVLWKPELSNTLSNLNSVCFSSQNSGWAVGDYGTILQYEDGIWFDKSVSSSIRLMGIVLSGEGDGWICGDVLIQLSDGNCSIYSDADSLQFNSMSMTSSTDIWAVGYNPYKLIHYDGTEWKLDHYEEFPIREISFYDSDHGLMGTDDFEGGRLVTFNHGTFSALGVTYITRAIFMVDSATGFACGNGGWWVSGDRQGHIYNYINGSWSYDTVISVPLTKIHGNKDLIWGVGQSGNIFLYQNDQWNLINSYTPDTFYEISFPDANHGWLIGDWHELYRYENGTLISDTLMSDTYLDNLFFTDTSDGYLTLSRSYPDQYNALLHYHEGEWQIENESIPEFPYDLIHTDDGTLRVLTINTIYKYENNQWVLDFSVPDSLTDYFYLHCYYVRPDLAYAVTSKTFDQSWLFRFDGAEWNYVRSNLPHNVTTIGAASDSFCWLVGSYGEIWRYDFLNDEIVQQCQANHQLTYDSDHIQMTSDTSGYFWGLEGAMEYDGEGWQFINGLPRIPFLDADFADPAHKWISGNYGILVNNYLGSSLDLPENALTSTLSASVYPNPVSDVSVLEYCLAKPARVTVEILDCLGVKVARIEESFRSNGIYRVPLNFKCPAPGIYFCSVSAGDQHSFLKLICR